MHRALLTTGSLVFVASLSLLAGCSDASDGTTGEDDPGTPPTSTLTGADASTGEDDPGSSSGGGTGSTGGGGGSPTDDGGVPVGACGPALDPSAAATISGYFDKLPYAAPTGAARAQITDAIIKSCAVFGPGAKQPAFAPKHCWAHLVAAIEKESSYNVNASVSDAYGTRSTSAGRANDPTVGLTQIRFSSTVRDMVVKGNTDALACVGCALPASFASHAGEQGDSAFWAVSGPTQNASLMKSVSCNVGLGAWYYYYNATSNGKASAPTYLAAYCGGGGTAGNLVTGLLSHLQGPENGKGIIGSMGALDALRSSNNGAYQYVTQIKTWFDSMVGPSTGTHPFFQVLPPNATQYCR